MKNFTVKEICEALEIKEATFRRWMLKVVEGEIYLKSNINYAEICKNVNARFSAEQQSEILGCAIEDVRIEKRERTKTEGVALVDVVIGGRYEVRNYGLKYRVEVKNIECIDSDVVYLCKSLEDYEYRTWTADYLMRDSIKIVELTSHVITID